MTLRIQRSIEKELVVFTLTGRIQAEHISELLASMRSEPPAHRVVFDLAQLKLVDRDAVLFLALSEVRGAELRNCPAYIREWISQEKNARRNRSEGEKEWAGWGE
jgi:hypothetical protein